MQREHIPERIHWHRTAIAPPACESLTGDTSADVVIVGAGLTGLRAAIDLADAGTDVVVLEAQQIGFGASGRSGGQCNPIWRKTPQELIRLLGQAQAEQLIRTTLSSADDLFFDIKKFGIDCGAEQNGWVQAAHSTKTAREMSVLGNAWRDAGADISELHGADVEKACGSSSYRFALRHAKGGFVHPLSLTRGYATTAQSMGARLFEDCHVKAIKRVDGRWQVTTPSGTIAAEQVVLTTNAYTDKLWPDLRKSLLPMVSVSLATAPLSTEQQASVLPGRVTVSDSRLSIYYSRYDADNRLIFGCVGSNDSAKTFGGLNRLRKGLRTVFPQIGDIPIECTWAGRIGVTPEMMPHLHEPASGVLAGLGFSGRGIAMTSVMGRTLARKLLGGANSELAFPVTPIKPIAGHWAARQLVPFMAPLMSMRDSLGITFDRQNSSHQGR
jgi:sarcosine oxidase